MGSIPNNWKHLELKLLKNPFYKFSATAIKDFQKPCNKEI